MISLGTNAEAAAPVAPATSIKVIGVGGAGLGLVAHLAAGDTGPFECVAMHTDVRALMASNAAQKVQLGRDAARGLGAGGEPSVGRAAAKESLGELRAACEGAPFVMVCAGLGGGTGSGAAPVVAEAAKHAGALVVGVVTLPFAGEGGRRSAQAVSALSQLGRHCVAVLCFENDRLAEIASEDSPVAEAFTAARETMAQAVWSLVRMVSLPSVLPVGLDELAQLFRGADARCQFGFGAASGSDRAREALEIALRSPMLEEGKMLSSPGSVLVHLTSDPTLTLAETQEVLRAVSRHADPSSQILLGVSTDPAGSGALGVTIMAATQASGLAELSDEDLDEVEEETEESQEAADGTPAEKSGARKGSKGGKKGDGRQEQVELPLDQPVRGRFKGLDPTIVDGQDLDVPTFIRLRIRI